MKCSNSSISPMSNTFNVLFLFGALSSIVFLFLPECYNGLSLDDFIFWNDLQKMSVWEWTANTYMTWQGRYLGYLVNGLQYRIFGFFESTIPFTLILYFVEILLVTKIYKTFLNWSNWKILVLSILTFGLFIASLPDISSYYWMCTKQYPLKVIMAIWLLVKIYSYSNNKWYDWVGIVICSCFVGCSTEVFAPMILVLLGVRILKLWKENAYSIPTLISKEKVLCVVFIVATINFFAMVFSPSTFIRMEVHAEAASLSAIEFVKEICNSSIQIAKMIFFKLHYYIAYFCLILVILRSTTTIKKEMALRQLIKRIIINIFITIGLFLLSMVLCEWACGQAFISRAFSQLPAAIYLLLFLLARDLCRTQLPKTIISSKCLMCFAICALLFVVANNIYSVCRAYPELEAYQANENARMKMLHELQEKGNTETIFLEPLDGAEYHSIMDDVWGYIMPSYSKILIFKPNEVANDVNQCYNVAFREYYKLDFDVISNLVYEGV